MFDIEKFEQDAYQNGIRYWIAHEFMEKLGYDSWSSFKAVIQKAMGNCLNLGIDVEDVFIPIELDDGTKSYRLTRFACFLVAMQADSKKQQVSKAQIALAALAEALLEEKLADTGITRIEERGKLTSAEKHLGAIAKSAGIQNGEYGIFKDAGFRGMYNMSLKNLQEYKGASSSKTLYGFMGITELAANTFRVTQTAERMKKNDVKGISQSATTAKQVGEEVRDIMLRSSGIAPEDLPLEGDISSVKKQIKSANKEMKKLDSPKNKKSKSKK
jgi:DNA-damage-inducible protein D